MKKADDSFEETLSNLYEPIDQNAIETSESEDEWDSCKGIDIYANGRTKKLGRKAQDEIIHGKKQIEKLLQFRMKPTEKPVLQDKYDFQRSRISEYRFETKKSKNH